MSLAEAIRDAAGKQSPKQAQEVAEFCLCKGFDYKTMMNMVSKSGVSPLEWEQLLQEATSGE